MENILAEILDEVRGRRSVAADSALRIGRALGMTLDIARTDADIGAIKPLVTAG